MSDPLSISAGVAGLISLGIEVATKLHEFYVCYKHRDTTVARTTNRLEKLLANLQALSDTLSRRRPLSGEDHLINQIESSIQQCTEVIDELQDQCKKLVHVDTNSKINTIRTTGRQIAYPFKKSTLEKLNEDIDEISNHLALALDILQIRDSESILDEVEETRSLLKQISNAQLSEAVRNWLKAPDVSTNHHAACALRHPKTGLWFVKGHVFCDWLAQSNSFLWLSGFPGCGKTILCSTAIQYIFRHKRSDPRTGIAFFYFTFSDESKQDDSAMLRAILVQLASQLPSGNTILNRLYTSHSPQSPPALALEGCLQRIIQQFSQVYILVDALDESPQSGPRARVLESIKTIRNISGVHLLVTARDLSDIRLFLNSAQPQELVLKNADVDRDISEYISGILKADPLLLKWEKHHEKIQETLSKRAQGIFRWAQCQLEAIKSCKRSTRGLEKCLQSLPQSLDETYERILCNIDEDQAKDARRLLTLLCFSARPLTVEELIHGMAVDIDNSRIDYDDLLEDTDSLHEICPTLIEFTHDYNVEEKYGQEDTHSRGGEPVIRARIAHFSVQEYLESSRIVKQRSTAYALSSGLAHAEIAKICCAYLLEPNLSEGKLSYSGIVGFPLARYAAGFWYHHYTNSNSGHEEVQELVFRIFTQETSSRTLLSLYDIDYSVRRFYFKAVSMDSFQQVYYASRLGLYHVLEKLLNLYCTSDPIEVLLKARKSRYGTPLQAAAVRGYNLIVQLLLSRGADINAQGGYYGTALKAALAKGYDSIVQLLLDRGADINAQGGYYGTALHVASAGGHDSIVQMLLDRGADINAQAFLYGTALHVASAGGYDSIVQMLLDRGADINAKGGYYGTALHAAAGRYDSIVQVLLDREADINAQDDHYGTALHVASAEGYDLIVQMLLNRGADINAQDDHHGTALQAASVIGHSSTVQVLLDRGADANAQGGRYGTALHVASAGGYDSIVQMLLDRGADINAQGGYYGTALQAALAKGYDSTVQVLLDRGADTNA